MSYNSIMTVQVAVGTGLLLARGCRVYRVKCSSVGGSIRLRNGSATGTILFDETMAVGAGAVFNSVPIWFRDGIYVEVFPGGSFSIYTD